MPYNNNTSQQAASTVQWCTTVHSITIISHLCISNKPDSGFEITIMRPEVYSSKIQCSVPSNEKGYYVGH